MIINSIDPIDIEFEDIDTYCKGSINVTDDGYFLIKFQDDTDDALSVPQLTKIHPVDLPNFVNMLNRAVNLL